MPFRRETSQQEGIDDRLCKIFTFVAKFEDSYILFCRPAEIQSFLYCKAEACQHIFQNESWTPDAGQLIITKGTAKDLLGATSSNICNQNTAEHS